MRIHGKRTLKHIIFLFITTILLALFLPNQDLGTVHAAKLNKKEQIMLKGEKFKLSLKGTSEKPQFTSLNPNIATLMEQTDPQRLQPGNIQLQHQTWNGKIDLGGNNRAIQLHSLKTDNSQDLLPPDQLVSMIHLFINDERFTSGITSFDIDFSRMKMP